MSFIKEIMHRYVEEEDTDIFVIRQTIRRAKEAVKGEKQPNSPSLVAQLEKLEKLWEATFHSRNMKVLEARRSKEENAVFLDKPLDQNRNDLLDTSAHSEFPFIDTLPRRVQEEYCALRNAMRSNARGVFQASVPSLKNAKAPPQSTPTAATRPLDAQSIAPATRRTQPQESSLEFETAPFHPPQNYQFVLWLRADEVHRTKDDVMHLNGGKRKKYRPMHSDHVAKSIRNFMREAMVQDRVEQSNDKRMCLQLAGEGYFHFSSPDGEAVRDSVCSHALLSFRPS